MTIRCNRIISFSQLYIPPARPSTKWNVSENGAQPLRFQVPCIANIAYRPPWSCFRMNGRDMNARSTPQTQLLWLTMCDIQMWWNKVYIIIIIVIMQKRSGCPVINCTQSFDHDWLQLLPSLQYDVFSPPCEKLPLLRLRSTTVPICISGQCTVLLLNVLIFYHRYQRSRGVWEKIRRKYCRSDHYSGQSSNAKESCSSTPLNRCTSTETRWNKKAVSRSSPEWWLILLLLLLLLSSSSSYELLYLAVTGGTKVWGNCCNLQCFCLHCTLS